MKLRSEITPRRLKSTLLLSSIALSAIILLSWTQEWFSLALDGGEVVSVGGDRAAPGLSALALAGLVLVGALSIAGRVFRLILGLLQAFIGVTVVFSAAVALADPIAASATAISELTGVAGTSSVTELVSQIGQSSWTWLAATAGCALVANGVAVVASSHRWPTSSKKYQSSTASPTAGEPSSVDDWDALTKGNDPT
jgi:hypothetical protein